MAVDLARHISQTVFFQVVSSGNDNGGADCVTSFDETVQMLSYAGVDGALERSCGFLSLLKRGAAVWLLEAQATARVDVPTAARDFIVFLSF